MLDQNTTFIKNHIRKIFIAALVFITVLVFLPSLENKFTNWDDDVYLLNNFDIRSFSWAHLYRIFTTPILGVYVPLTILSYSFEYHFFGYNPFIYHLNNLLLHMAVVILIFLFLFKLSKNNFVAFWAALLFAIHPMHVESVAWITERKDVLYAFFYMLSLLNYCRYLEGKKYGYKLAIVFGLLSILSKPMALSLPLIFFLCDYYYRREFKRNILFDKLPHLIYIAPIVWVSYVSHLRIPGMQQKVQSILVWVWTASFYIKKFIFPIVLTPLYTLPQPVKLFETSYIIAVLITTLFLLILFICRRNRVVVFAFLFYFLNTFFLFRFDNYIDKCIVADRFMYLPSLGFCFLAAVLVNQILSSNKFWIKSMTIFVLSIILLCLAFATFQQTKIWKNGESLWKYVLKVDPTSVTGYLNLGNIYNEEQKFDLALVNYKNALIYDPQYAEVYSNRGVIYFLKGLKKEAMDDFNKAIAIRPDYADVYNNRANAYSIAREYQLAMRDYAKALELDPNLWKTLINRGSIYLLLKQYDLALQDYNKALGINRDYDEGYLDRGKVFFNLQQYDESIADYTYYLSKSRSAEGYLMRSYAWAGKKQFDKAIDDALMSKSLGGKIQDEYLRALKDDSLKP